MKGRVGLQVVVDNHTLDDSLLKRGWDVQDRAVMTHEAMKTHAAFWKLRRQARRQSKTVAGLILARDRARRQRKGGGHGGPPLAARDPVTP